MSNLKNQWSLIDNLKVERRQKIKTLNNKSLETKIMELEVISEEALITNQLKIEETSVDLL